MAQAGTSLPDLLSISELADYLGVPVSTIHYWRGKEQGPPALKVGRRLRFRTVDVARWLSEKREAGFPASEPLADENVDGKPTVAA
jgi:excisionase family DNA binding protein